MHLKNRETINSHQNIINLLNQASKEDREVIYIDRRMDSDEQEEYLYDPISRIDDIEIFCSGKWHHLSGKDYTPEFHSALNLFYDQYIRTLSPNHSLDDLSSRQEFKLFVDNISKIAGKEVNQISLTITGYGAELKIHDTQTCPESFSLVNIYTDKPDDPDPSCIKICFSGEITSQNPIVI